MEKVENLGGFNCGTIVVAGFPGIGKSFLKDIGGDRVADLHHKNFDRDSFPENCVDYVQSLLGKAEIILTSTHRDVLMELERVGIDYILVYPDKSLKNEYLDRYKKSTYKDSLNRKWELFMKNMEGANPAKRIILKSGEYLKDKLNLLYL